MPHGHPDYYTAVIPSMPVAGEGQIAWYQSDEAVVAAGGNADLINYVVPDDYELRVCSGVISANFPFHSRYDLRQTPAATWIRPHSHIDADEKWSEEENAYDGDTGTGSNVNIPAVSWSAFLILLVNEQYIDKIKFYASWTSGVTDLIDIDVYYGGIWVHVYEGVYGHRIWTEKNILAGASLISKARIRIHNAAAYIINPYLSEFQFNSTGTTPQKGIYFDTNAIIPYLPQAPYLVEAGATFAVRAYNDDDAPHTASIALAGFLQKKV